MDGLDCSRDTKHTEIWERDTGSFAAVLRAEAVQADVLVDAAWKALTSGRPRELRVLEELLERAAETGSVAEMDGLELQALARRLELVLAATARNLRIMRGPCRMGQRG